MADQPKFPAQMHHPVTGGETTAATASSLRVLESRGWKRGPKPTERAGDTPRHAGGAVRTPPPPPDSDQS